MKILLWIFTSLLLANCATLGVEPWERDLLSEEEMIFGSDSVELGYEQHTYFSKEASSGGNGFSGGGCGCN
jgi:hypothetical protein